MTTTTVEELRKLLVRDLDGAMARLESARAEVSLWENGVDIAKGKLDAHDNAVAAMGFVEPTIAAQPDRQRRSIVAEVEKVLPGGINGYSIDHLCALIDNVRPAQVETALAKMKSQNKAWVDEGLWRAGAEPVPHVPIGEHRAPPPPPGTVYPMPDAANG